MVAETLQESDLGNGSPTMSHLVLHGQRLDDAYPQLVVPEDDDLQDAARDEDDATFQAGLREAVEIAREARDHGRKRRMSPSTQPSEDSAEKETEGVVQLVEEQDVATVRSTLGRRRSKREGPVPQPPELHVKNPEVKLTSETVIVDSVVDARLSLLHIVSQSDSCACVLHRLARAVLPGIDHPAHTPLHHF